MKALRVQRYGTTFNKTLKFEEIDKPTLNKGEVLIEVHAAALNPADYKIMAGAAKLIHKAKFPYCIGFDLAGTIVECDDNADIFNVGDSVFTKVPWHQIGAITEYTCVDANMVAHHTNKLTPSEAASLPLVACTFIEAFEYAKMKPGQRALIVGASGGVGTFAVQYAKHMGVDVVACTSTKNIELVQSLGADEIIDYTEENSFEAMKAVDVVFDLIGKDYPKKTLSKVKNGGKIVSIAWHLDNDTLKVLGINSMLRWLNDLRMHTFLRQCNKRNIVYKHVFSYPSREQLQYVNQLVESNAIKPLIDRIYPFEQAIEAIEYLRSERAAGKVVIQIKP